jgi:hypothetical protein
MFVQLLKFCLIKFIFFLGLFYSVYSRAQVILSENFETGLNGWRVNAPPNYVSPHDWKWYADAGTNNGGGLRMKYYSDSNYIASPGVALQAGKTYTISFKTRVPKGSSTRSFTMGWNSHRSPSGQTTLLSTSIPTNTYVDLPFTTYNPTFTPNTTDVYYFIFDFAASGYLFTYFDEVIIEETNFPIISITGPSQGGMQNESYPDTTKLTLKADASDIDGTIKRVEFFMNDNLVGIDSFFPYELTLYSLLPKEYKIKARATDDRGNMSWSSNVDYYVNMRDGSLKNYLHYDFNTNNKVFPNKDYWLTSNGDFALRSGGFQGTQGFEIFSSYAGNLVVSTGFYLQAGQNYNYEFLATSSSGNRPVHIFLTKEKSLLDSITLKIDTVKQNEAYSILHVHSFTVNQSGVYYLGLHYPTVNNYIQLRFENIRIIGDQLNVGPVAKITQPSTASIKTVENATITLKSNVFDIDGAPQTLSYYANNDPIAVGNNNIDFEGSWTVQDTGRYTITARPTDNQGAQTISLPIQMQVVPNDYTIASILGSTKDDEIRGLLFQDNGATIIAANAGSLPNINARRYLLNNATEDSSGVLIRLSTDHQRVISITRLCSKIADIAQDSIGNVYVAAWNSGLIKINKNLDSILWHKALANYAHRVDASKSGKTIVLCASESDINDGTLSGSVRTYLHDSNGGFLTEMGGISQYGADVAIDDATQSVYMVGFKNFNTQGELANKTKYPVFVPVLRAKYFDNTTRFVGYDWDGDTSSMRWLNRPANNMADARLNRIVIGKDGNLYFAGQVYGGNHLFRYSPYNIMQTATVVGGDSYFNLSNTGTESHVFVGKMNPVTGDYLYGQTFTARLTNTKGNSVFIDRGAIDVDSSGRIYLVGASASGLPLTVDHMPGEYTGGAYFLRLSPDMRTREECIRMAFGYNKAVVAINNQKYLFGGYTENTDQIYNHRSLQSSNNNQNGSLYELSWSLKDKLLCPNTTLSSKTNGSWSDINTWTCNQVPDQITDVIVNPLHTVIGNNNGMNYGWKLSNYGNVIINTGSVIKMVKQ